MHDIASAVRTATWCIYGIAGFIWFVAIAFAGFRIYQMRTLVAVQAEVLNAATDSYTATARELDSDRFTYETQETVYVPVARVRYEFHGKTYTVAARHDTGSGFKSIEDRITRRWKPGTRIRVHLDPSEPDRPIPDLGLNAHTFQMSIVAAIAGGVFALFGYGFGWLGSFGFRLFEQLKQTQVR